MDSDLDPDSNYRTGILNGSSTIVRVKNLYSLNQDSITQSGSRRLKTENLV